MDLEGGLLPSIISAASGLLGAVIGGSLTIWNERRKEKRLIEQTTAFLAVRVLERLDEFASRCGAVAYDDGTSEGRPAGEDGQNEPTEKIPRFTPLDIDVDWKVLPKGLMYDVMSLPQRQLEITHRLAVIADHPDPPDHPEYFLTRQLEYAKLGVHVSGLSARLRAHAGLPPYKAGPDSWDRDTELPSRVNEIAQEFERRRKPSPA